MEGIVYRHAAAWYRQTVAVRKDQGLCVHWTGIWFIAFCQHVISWHAWIGVLLTAQLKANRYMVWPFGYSHLWTCGKCSFSPHLHMLHFCLLKSSEWTGWEDNGVIKEMTWCYFTAATPHKQYTFTDCTHETEVVNVRWKKQNVRSW